ncbi:MAG: hydantoinase/oxoprolinase family protein [Candidatus Rokubacteria bacterium]|nr:hydantoinase/oxoprolinase family protein [Candidatus Rokubacteria bacterium]
MTSPAFRVGVDIGGTFTDLVALGADGAVHTKKVSSSVDDYARAILDGLRDLCRDAGLSPRAVAEVLHGTTVASNAILELRGARTGLVTTRGFRDVLEIRRLRMPRLYDLAWEKPVPLVERRLRAEVGERINARGEVLEPLDQDGVERALDHLLAEGIEALAVCLLNAYANPAHERAIEAIVRRRAPDLPVCLSAEVLPEIKEYERTSTTVINAYVLPVVRRYLGTLRDGLAGIGVGAPLHVMQSNGGLMSAEAAARQPMHIIESGPAAGVVGAHALCRRLGLDRVITFDMGGTTAKASSIEDGAITRTAEIQVGGGIMLGSRLLTGAGYLLRVPAIDLAEVGAGGGSVVWIDPGGALRVGPRSAGASPGPLCYDLGGEEPTITDASLILGYLNPRELAGGAVKLAAARAHEGFEARVARPLGLPLAEAAHGAHLIAASNMIRAIRAVSTERGRDPREFVLFAFGGNGPLFAAGMARALEMRRIVVPPAPGLFSAFGLLYAEVEHHGVRTLRVRTRDADPAEMARVWEALAAEGRGQLAGEGARAGAIRARRFADLRYHGQTSELTVPVGDGPLDVAALEEAFGREYERTYGQRGGPGEPIEVVNLRVVVQALADRPRVSERVRVDRAASLSGVRRAYFGPGHGWLDTPVVGREALAARRAGPCIVEEYDATCLVPPGATAWLDGQGNIVMELA